MGSATRIGFHEGLEEGVASNRGGSFSPVRRGGDAELASNIVLSGEEADTVELRLGHHAHLVLEFLELVIEVGCVVRVADGVVVPLSKLGHSGEDFPDAFVGGVLRFEKGDAVLDVFRQGERAINDALEFGRHGESSGVVGPLLDLLARGESLKALGEVAARSIDLSERITGDSVGMDIHAVGTR